MIRRNPYAAQLTLYAATMQQYAAILFSIEHPFWINFAHKNIPILKFEAQWNHLIRKNPNTAHLIPNAACMQQYAAKFFSVKHPF